MSDRHENNWEKRIFHVTIVGSLVNALLVAFKFTAGVAGHSAAMVADAVHSLSDFITDLIILLFVHIANKPVDKNHDYGHGKYETMATALIGMALLAVGGGILLEGARNIARYLNGETLEGPGFIALAAAIASIVLKELLYQYTVSEGKKLNSQAVIANAWHHRSDAFSSLGTAAGIAGAIFLGKKGRVLDPLAAVVVSGFILKVAANLLKTCIDELLEKSLPDEVEKEITDIATSFDGVSQPHNLRTRRIGNRYAIELHIRMDGQISLEQAHQTTVAIEQKLKARFGQDTHIGIHVEPLKN